MLKQWLICFSFSISIILTKKNVFFLFLEKTPIHQVVLHNAKKTKKDHYLWQTKCNCDRQNQIIQELTLTKLKL